MISVVIDLKMGLGSHTDARYEWAEDWGWKDLQQENIWIEDERWKYLQQETTGTATMLSNEITRRRRRRRKRKILHAKKTQHKQISNNVLLSNMIKLSSLIEKAVLRNKPNNQIKLQRGLMSKLSYSCSQPCQHDGDIIYAAFIRNLTTVKTFKRRETSVKFHFILFTQSHF